MKVEEVKPWLTDVAWFVNGLVCLYQDGGHVPHDAEVPVEVVFSSMFLGSSTRV